MTNQIKQQKIYVGKSISTLIALFILLHLSPQETNILTAIGKQITAALYSFN